jgi:hypothetical protein
LQQLPYVGEDLLQRFDVDFRMVQLPAATAPGLHIFEEGDYYAFIDRWGSKLHMPKSGGYYFDWVDFPIKETTMEELAAMVGQSRTRRSIINSWLNRRKNCTKHGLCYCGYSDHWRRHF